MLTILPPTAATWKCLHQSDARYLAGELVQVRVTRKGFQPEYAPLSKAEWRVCRARTGLTRERMEKHAEWACFFAFQDGRFVGQVILRQSAYQLCELLDIRVDVADRRQGIGTQLLIAGEDWARKRQMKGIVAEASDQNPVACQFFQNRRFVLGGVDKLRHYADLRQADKPAALRDSVLSFYYFFD